MRPWIEDSVPLLIAVTFAALMAATVELSIRTSPPPVIEVESAASGAHDMKAEGALSGPGPLARAVGPAVRRLHVDAVAPHIESAPARRPRSDAWPLYPPANAPPKHSA